MKGGAFIGDELNPRATVPRLTNLDLIRHGSPGYERLRAIIALVNTRIAPATINDRSFGVRQDVRAIEFRGKWGTFHVSFLLSEQLVDRAMIGQLDWLAMELEHLMNGAIRSALRDLIVAELESVEADRFRLCQHDIAQLAARVLHLETPAWRRLWIRFQQWWAR